MVVRKTLVVAFAVAWLILVPGAGIIDNGGVDRLLVVTGAAVTAAFLLLLHDDHGALRGWG